jgi:hypothetical protein
MYSYVFFKPFYINAFDSLLLNAFYNLSLTTKSIPFVLAVTEPLPPPIVPPTAGTAILYLLCSHSSYVFGPSSLFACTFSSPCITIVTHRQNKRNSPICRRCYNPCNTTNLYPFPRRFDELQRRH